jgi:tRNA pseudouridine13 synthase
VTVSALLLPHAYPPLPVAGVLRRCPEDFVVEERATHGACDRGEHLLLWIEKRAVNSQQVAAELARHFGVPPIDVSFAGMKDRHAVTRQWFSVRTPRSPAGEGGDGWRIVGAQRAQHKLRRGDLTGNAFTIRIHELRGDRIDVTERLEQLRERGVPNYFGEQRFGHDGANVERARAWIGHRPRAPVSAFQKGLHLSTARALLFNAVLAARVSDGTWFALIDGDVADGDFPTGPLWGRGRRASTGCAARREDHALAAYADWLDPLEHLGIVQERRSLVARPIDLRWSFNEAMLELSFALAAGQYATAVLRELGTWCNAAAGHRQ